MTLTRQRADAITLMVEGQNITNIAKTLDVNRTTIYNWMKTSSFQMELRSQLRHFLHAKILMSVPHVEEAIATLVDIMRDSDVKPSDRINAADKILNLSTEALSASLAVEIDELKAALGSGDD